MFMRMNCRHVLYSQPRTLLERHAFGLGYLSTNVSGTAPSRTPTPNDGAHEQSACIHRHGNGDYAPGRRRVSSQPVRAHVMYSKPAETTSQPHAGAVVADLEKALLGTSRARYVAHGLTSGDFYKMRRDNVRPPEDAEDEAEAEWPNKQVEEEKRRALRHLNMNASDLVTREGKLPASFSLNGIARAAQCRSIPAMLFYLKHLEKAPVEEFAWAIRSIRLWIERDDFAGTQGSTNKKMLMTVLTGYPTGRLVGKEEQSIPNLAGMMSGPGRAGIGIDLAVSVSELGGAPALMNLWSNHLHGWDISPPSRSVLHEERATTARRSLLDVVIAELCRATPPDFDAAWKLAESLFSHPHGAASLSQETWEGLLSSPEHIDRHGGWRPEMETAAKQAMESWANRIEQELGVLWDPRMKEHQLVNEEARGLYDHARLSLSDKDPVDMDDADSHFETTSLSDDQSSIIPQDSRRQQILAERGRLRKAYENIFQENYGWMNSTEDYRRFYWERK